MKSKGLFQQAKTKKNIVMMKDELGGEIMRNLLDYVQKRIPTKNENGEEKKKSKRNQIM